MIEARHLVKRFGADVVAVDDVSFVVSPGEIYCVLGGRGSGRTSIVKLLLGAIDPSRGQALIGGTPVVHSTIAVRQRVTFVLAGGSMYPAMTARDNVVFFARMGGARVQRAEVENAMRRMSIPERCFDRRVRDLPARMPVMLWLAVAALRNTQALVLDDPLVHADPRAIDELQEGLQELAASGKAILVTTSDVLFATRIADRIGILQNGRLVAEHSKAEMLNQPVTQLLGEYVGPPVLLERAPPSLPPA